MHPFADCYKVAGMPHPLRNTPEVIQSRLIVRPDTGCHMWPGQTDKYGYGYASIGGKKRVVHRILWEAFRGPVPAGLELDHTCEVNGCANLGHLEPVTPAVNCQRRHTRNGFTNGTQEGAGALSNCKANHPEGCWYTRPGGKTGYCKRRDWRTRKAA